MNRINPSMLNDTLNLVQLARETALAGGKAEQARRLSPVVDDLRSLVSQSREAQPAKTTNASASGLMAQSDFRTLLAATSKQAAHPAAVPATSSASGAERNQIISAMSAGGMSDLDIARQMGIAREEVQMILSIHRS